MQIGITEKEIRFFYRIQYYINPEIQLNIHYLRLKTNLTKIKLTGMQIEYTGIGAY